MKAIDYASPKSIPEVVTLLSRHGNRARILAGGTDIIVQVRENRRDLDLLVDVKKVPEVNEITFDPLNGLRLGAAVPCYRIQDHPHIARIYPGLIDAVSLVGGVQIQSRASIGGNLCNASPAADTIPPLIAYGAICTIAGSGGIREIPVELFCTGVGRTVLGSDEFLLSLRIPIPQAHTGGAYQRFIPRNEMDIAVVGVGATVTLDSARNRCIAARIALAAVAPTPLLVMEAGHALMDGTLSDSLIEKAAAVAQQAARPITDMRGDADYRRHLVGVLTRRTVRQAINRAKEKQE